MTHFTLSLWKSRPKTCGPTGVGSGTSPCFDSSGRTIIPSFINSDMQKLLNVFPLPTNPNEPDRNLVVPSTENRPAHQEILRLDYNISPSGQKAISTQRL